MTTDLVPVGTADEIATLPPADRAVMVTHALIETKQWLAVAMKGTDPTPIAEWKAWAATVVEMTRQKGLASEIQSDALEMLRRTERGIGVAIRNGQEAGEIAKNGDKGGASAPGVRGAVAGFRSPASELLISPHVAAQATSRRELSEVYYPLADNVTDERFEEVLNEARAEGDLSRANVKRKIGVQAGQTRAQRVELITAMAEQGHSSPQIARHVGITEVWVRQLARDEGVTIPGDRAIQGTRRFDSTRVVRETVEALEGLVIVLPMVDTSALNVGEVAQWSASLDQSIWALTQFNKALKEALSV